MYVTNVVSDKGLKVEKLNWTIGTTTEIGCLENEFLVCNNLLLRRDDYKQLIISAAGHLVATLNGHFAA